MIGLGASNSMGIGIALYLDDQLSQKAQQATASLRGLEGATDSFIKAFERIDQVGQGMSSFGNGMIKSLAPAVKSFARFEDIMNSVRVIAGDQGLTPVDYSKMITQVKSLGEQYGILPEDIASAQLELAKAGIKPKEIMRMTEATMALGAATDTVVSGAGGAAEMLVNVMQAFNATADEADRFAAVMTAAANESTIDVTDFYQSMRYTADIARSLSIPIEDTSAAIAMLGNAGLKGSIAGTSLANMYRYLAKAVGQFGLKRQKEALGMLGIQESDLLTAEGSLKSLSEILAVFRKQYEGMTDIQRLAATQGLFGVRGDRAAQPLIRALRMDTIGLDGKPMAAFEDMLQKIEKGVEVNIHIDQAQRRLDDLMGDWGKFMSAVERLKIAIGGALGPVLRPLIRGLQQGVMSLTEFFEGKNGQLLVKLFAGVGTWLVVVGKLLSWAARFYKYMLTATSSLSQTFAVGKTVSKYINRQLVSGSFTFLTNIKAAAATWTAAMLASKGITGHVQGGTSVLVGRDKPTGQFTGERAKRGWLSTSLGVMFGKSGLKWASKLSKAFAPVVKILGPVATIGKGLFKVFGGLFKVVGWIIPRLFSWWTLIADVVSQLTTGKSIFEWLWIALKHTADFFMGLFGPKKKKDETGKGSYVESLKKGKGPKSSFLGGFGSMAVAKVSPQDQAYYDFMDFRTKAERDYIHKLLEGKTPSQQNDLKKTLVGLDSAELERFQERVKTVNTPTNIPTIPDDDRQRIIDNMNRMRDTGMIAPQATNDRGDNETPKGDKLASNTPTTINLTINPQPDRVTKKTIELDPQRTLQSYAVS